MAFTLATTAQRGWRAGVAAALGIGAGSFMWAGFTAAGLAALAAMSPVVLSILRIVGGAYLLFLAYKTLRTKRLDYNAAQGAEGFGASADAFRAGVLTNLLNPKVGLFYLAFLPGFTAPAAGPIWSQTLMLGAIFSLSGALVLIATAAVTAMARTHFARGGDCRAPWKALAAAVYAGLGFYLLASSQPSR